MARVLIAIAAVLSGVAALGYELLWVRRLGEAFGATVYAVNLVLAIFFLGMGVGARLLGGVVDRARRPGLWFAGLEGFLALYAVAFLPLSTLVERLLLAATPAEWSFGASMALKGVAALLLLAPPALAMGGTLPALVRAAGGGTRTGDDPGVGRGIGRRVGLLYGLNTVGGAIGVGAVTLIGLPRLGIPGSFAAAAGLNLVAAVLAIVAARSTPPRLPASASGRATSGADGATSTGDGAIATSSTDRRVLLLAAGLAGFLAVGLEVLWTRALSARFLSTLYSFATILAAYLGCLGVGALLVGLLERWGRAGRGAAAAVMTGAGLTALVSVILLGRVPASLAHGADPGLTFAARQGFELRHAVGVMALPLLLFGMNFPLLVRLVHRDPERLGRDVGAVTLANTVGAVLAPLLVGFVLLPALGQKPALLLLALLGVAAGVGLLLPWAGARGWTWAVGAAGTGTVAVFLVLATPGDLRLWRFTDQDTLVAYREGVSASIAVAREPDGNLFLKLDNNYRLGDERTRFAQERQGLLPLLLHPAPERMLFIGVGTGSSVGAAVAFGDVAVDALDVIPELTEVLPHFHELNRDLVTRAGERPDVRLLTVDARHFVRATERRYDVVVGDLFVPWRAGEGGMYTVEHFRAVRDVLTDDGVFVQWLPLYQLRPEETAIVVRTFLEVFPGASLTWLYYNAREPVVGLVGSAGAASWDAVEMLTRMSTPARKALLEEAGLADVRAVLGSRIAGPDVLAEWTRDLPVESRAHPRIEVWSGLGRFGDIQARSRRNLVEMLRLTTPVTQDELPGLDPHHFAAVLRHQRGVASYLRARHLDLHGGDAAEAMDAYAAAFLDLPDQRITAYLLEQAIQEAVRRKAFRIAEVGIHAFRSLPDTEYLGHYYAAEMAMTAGQVDAARDALRKALALNPEHEPSWRLLTRIDPGAGS